MEQGYKMAVLFLLVLVPLTYEKQLLKLLEPGVHGSDNCRLIGIWGGDLALGVVSGDLYHVKWLKPTSVVRSISLMCLSRCLRTDDARTQKQLIMIGENRWSSI